MVSERLIDATVERSMTLDSMNEMIKMLVLALNEYVDKDFDYQHKLYMLNHLNSLNFKLGMTVQKHMANLISLSDSYFCLSTKCANDPVFAKKTLSRVFNVLKKKYEEQAINTRTELEPPHKWVIPPVFKVPHAEVPDIAEARSAQATEKAHKAYAKKHYWTYRKHWTKRGALKHIAKLRTALQVYQEEAESRSDAALICMKNIERTRKSIANKQEQLKPEALASIWADSHQCYVDLARKYIVEAYAHEISKSNGNSRPLISEPTTSGSVSLVSTGFNTFDKVTGFTGTLSSPIAKSPHIHKAKSMQLKPQLTSIMNNNCSPEDLCNIYRREGNISIQTRCPEYLYEIPSVGDSAKYLSTQSFNPSQTSKPAQHQPGTVDRNFSQASNSSSCYEECYSSNGASTPDTPVDTCTDIYPKKIISRGELVKEDHYGSLRCVKSRPSVLMRSRIQTNCGTPVNSFAQSTMTQISPLHICKKTY